MAGKTAMQYLQEAWNAVERRSLEDLKEVRKCLCTQISSYYGELRYQRRNLEFLEISKVLMKEEYINTKGTIADLEGDLMSLEEVCAITVTWRRMMM